TIHAAQLLLFAQLRAVLRETRAALTLDAARRHLELALALERLDAALQEQVRALAAGELALRTGVLGHLMSSCGDASDATLLGGTAAVVRNRRDVRDAGDLQAAVVERADRRLAARTRTR